MPRRFWVGIIILLVIGLVFQYSLLFHLNTPLGLVHGDSSLV